MYMVTFWSLLCAVLVYLETVRHSPCPFDTVFLLYLFEQEYV